jgi:hypothetical protein
VQQFIRHRHERLVWYVTIYATHPPHLWRLAELLTSAQELGIPESAPPVLPAASPEVTLA